MPFLDILPLLKTNDAQPPLLNDSDSEYQTDNLNSKYSYITKTRTNFLEQLHIAVFGGVYHRFNVFASGHSISNTNSKYTADIIQ